MESVNPKVMQWTLMACLLASAPAMAAKPPDVDKGGSAGEIEALQQRVETLENENALQGADIDNLKSTTTGQGTQIAALDARLGNAETGLGNLTASLATQQGSLDGLATDIDLLVEELAAQQAINKRQAKIITSLRNVLRSNRKLAQAQAARADFGRSAEVALEMKNTLERMDTPVQIPFLTWRNWVDQARDMGEATRCKVAGMTPKLEDDCVLIDGTVIPPEEQGTVVLSQEEFDVVDTMQVVTLDPIIDTAMNQLYNAAEAAGFPGPCSVWKNTRGRLVEYGCMLVLGLTDADPAIQSFFNLTKDIEEVTVGLLGDNLVETELVCEVRALNVGTDDPVVECVEEGYAELLNSYKTIHIEGEKKFREDTNCSKFHALFSLCEFVGQE